MAKQEDTKVVSSKSSAVKKILVVGGLVIMALASGSAGMTLYLGGHLGKLGLGSAAAVTPLAMVQPRQ